MLNQLNPSTRFLLSATLALLFSTTLALSQTLTSDPISSSGREYMAPPKEVNGQLIGQEDVLIQ